MSVTQALVSWIGDRLHSILGFSETSVAQYIAALAAKATNHATLHSQIMSCDIPDTPESRAFAEQLFARVPRAKVQAPGRKVPSNADLVRQSAQYGLLDSDGEDGDASSDHKSKTGKAKKKDKRKYHERKRRTKSDDEDGDEGVHPRASAVVRPSDKRARQELEAKGAEVGLEEARDADARERDEFVERMRERDAEKTKKFDLKGLSEAQVKAMATRGSVGVEPAADVSVSEMREVSRRLYLAKREAKQVELAERQLEDEAEMFDTEDITEAERKRQDLNRKIIGMAKERDRFDTAATEGYRIPTSYEQEDGKLDLSQREAVLTARYEEEGEKQTEEDAWMDHQGTKAVFKAGAKDRQTREEAEGYEYVFDDEIEFVITQQAEAKLSKKKKKKRRDGEDGGDKDEDGDKGVPLLQPAEDMTGLSEYEKIRISRMKLPAFAYRDEFLAAVKDNQVLVVVGETGSGKTTQLPQYLHEVGYTEVGKIGCTQPRRVAAMSVAARVSQELGVKLGQEVGYSIRFEDCTSENTVIKYMTDGMLLREFLGEPDLASYSVMIIDEAHERTLHTDVLFGLIKDIARFRDDIKIIISSATLNAEAFANFFDDAAIFTIPGRTHPVDILYTKSPEADYLDAAVVTVLQIHISQPLPGDILVFLTGQEEIESAVEILTQRTRGLGSRIKELNICPIYSTLPSEQQAKIFEKTAEGSRKVVLGTNIAETSLTIDGICFVIDTGFCKQKTYNPRTGMESLIVTPVSRAAAQQRAGRAGRTQPGKCFRLYTNWSFMHELEEQTVPDIQRSNMGNVVLMLKSLGIHDLLHFDFMDPPPAEALIRALEQLYALGALNDRGELTKLGRRMAEFPTDPMMSKALIASEAHKCSVEMLTIAAMLSINNSVFYRPKDKAVHADNARMNFARGGGGDHMCLMRCYNEWVDTNYSTQWCYENYLQVRSLNKARDVREQLEGLCERVEINMVSSAADIDAVCKAVTSGYFYHTAKFGQSGDYRTVKHSHTVYIHPSSCLAKEEDRPPWVLYHELAFTTKEYMRSVAPIKPEWLVEIAPHYYESKDVEDSRAKKMPKAVPTSKR